MKTLPLFDDKEQFNDDGQALHRKVREALIPIVAEALKKGFRRIEIENIVHGAAMTTVIWQYHLLLNEVKASA